MSIVIPSIGVDSPPLIELGLDVNGVLTTPPVESPQVGGWYAAGVVPGDIGPAVIAAHVNGRVDGKSTPGLFARLAGVHRGAEVRVTRTDGSVAVFEVYRVSTHPKSSGIPDDVYADTTHPELRLITCGGEYDPAARSYRDNIVVWAATS